MKSLKLDCFAVLFLIARYLVAEYTGLTGYWIPLTAFAVGNFLAPKFYAVKNQEVEKFY